MSASSEGTNEGEDEPTIISTRRPEFSGSPTMPPLVPRHRALLTPMLACTEFRPGKLFSGQYLVDRVVGSVGACVLVKVRHARLGQPFILKYLMREATREPNAVQKFLHAAQASMTLRSVHVARTVDAGRLGSGLPYVVMESFQGATLREILYVRGALAPTEAVDFVLQAAEAVAEAHGHGLVHGSLSPSTLFVTRAADGLLMIKVLDFGSSETLRSEPLALKLQSWDEGTAIFWESSRLWDTLAYSAPEQLRHGGEPTPLSDVWGLGATLYELLSGAAPFRGENTTSFLATVATDEPAPLTERCKGLPQALAAVVLRCLSKQPHARYAAISELAGALRPFASSRGQLSIDRITSSQSSDSAQLAVCGQLHAIVPHKRASWPSPAPERPSTAQSFRPHPLRSVLVTALAASVALIAVVAATRGAVMRGTEARAPVSRSAVADEAPPVASPSVLAVSSPSASPSLPALTERNAPASRHVLRVARRAEARRAPVDATDHPDQLR